MKIIAPFLPCFLAVALMGISASASADAAFERKVEERLAKLEQQNKNNGSQIADKLTITGVVEIEASIGEGFDDKSYSDLTVATVEVSMSAELTDKVGAEVIFLYEQDETELDVDVATLSFDQIIGPVDLLIGKQYLPFGRFETALVNDTLILELAETNKTAAVFSLEQDGLIVGAHLFDGSVDRERHVENWGLTFQYGQDNWAFGADYISSLAESDGLSGFAEDEGLSLIEEDGAFTVSGSLGVDVITIVAEYLSSVSDIKWDTGAGEVETKPSAIQIEVDFNTELSGKEYVFAFAIQESDEAGGYLSEQRISFGGSTSVYENVGIEVRPAKVLDLATSIVNH
jgi:hypothetical protein